MTVAMIVAESSWAEAGVEEEEEWPRDLRRTGLR